jgi:arginase
MTQARGRKALYTLGIATDMGLDIQGANLAPHVLFRSFQLNEKLRDLGIYIACTGANEIMGANISLALRDSTEPKEQRMESITQLSKQVASRITTDLDGLKAEQVCCNALFLGGDHSIAMGTYAGVANHLKHRLGVLWLDAHGDFHVWNTSQSKNIHGMALAAILGQVTSSEELKDESKLFACCPTKYRPRPDEIIILGARSLDFPEVERLRKLGIVVYTATDIERYGLKEVMSRVVDAFKAKDIEMKVHVSLDLDVIDPVYAPGVSTPCSAGLTERELFYVAEALNSSTTVFSLDVVEYNIMNDDKDSRTAHLASEAILHFFGKTYYPGLRR